MTRWVACKCHATLACRARIAVGESTGCMDTRASGTTRVSLGVRARRRTSDRRPWSAHGCRPARNVLTRPHASRSAPHPRGSVVRGEELVMQPPGHGRTRRPLEGTCPTRARTAPPGGPRLPELARRSRRRRCEEAGRGARPRGARADIVGAGRSSELRRAGGGQTGLSHTVAPKPPEKPPELAGLSARTILEKDAQPFRALLASAPARRLYSGLMRLVCSSTRRPRR